MNSGIYETEEMVSILSRRLTDKDLIPVEVSRLIRDVVNIIGDGGDFTLYRVNQNLENLGWRGKILDEFTFELILSLLENEYGYRAVTHTVH
jgi:hypothetical protein